MLRLRFYRLFTPVMALALGVLVGCASVNQATNKVAAVAQPYKIDIVQGNVVTREQVEFLKPGMPRNTVRDVLGSALLVSVFHADRWDYVFTLKRQGAEPQSRRVTVFFKNDVLERIEADELPSEAEFVATLRSEPKSGPLPALEAPQEKLKQFPAAPPKPAAPAPASPATSYPPLEPKAP
jgi:outer membrane protein assembly factor BamE